MPSGAARIAPIGRTRVGTLSTVPPPAVRTARSAGAALIGPAVLALGLLTGCGRSAADPGPGGGAATTSTAPVRTVPDPVDGALSTYVEATEAERPPAELLLFGDSVAVLVADELARELDRPLVVDGVDCRRLDLGFAGPCGGVPAGTDVPPALADLAPAVERLEDPASAAAVVVLANNAALAAPDLDAAMAGLQPLPRVWWVTTRVDGRGWQDPNNALLADLAARDPRAAVVDWFAASDGQDWLADHVHPNDAGQAAFAELVAAHVRCDCTP